MMRIYTSFLAHRDSETPQHVARAPGLLVQNVLVWGCLLILIVLALLTGYYAHYHWLQRFPPEMNNDTSASVEQDYRLSDMHYVFKKQPLPTRPMMDMSEDNTVDNEAEYSQEGTNEEPVAEEDVTSLVPQTSKEVLREQVQKALAEMDEE